MSVVFNSFLFLSILLSWITLSLGLSAATFLGNETDRLALLAFKSQITQDPQMVMSSWNDSLHFCEWEGVECSSRHQRVTVLNLDSKGLMGPISPHIGNLSFLRVLALFNNSFHGEIPQEIGKLSRLQGLGLNGNLLGGKIPVNISRCSSLLQIFSSDNNLVGEIPEEFGSLSQLIELNLGTNKLSGMIPPSLGNLTYLETLTLRVNRFDGRIPSTLGQLKYLRTLGLSSNELSGIFPSSLYNLSAIEVLSAAVNQLSGNLHSEIDRMLPNLQILFIGANRFSGPIPASLFNASILQRIDIGENQLTGQVPLNVGNLKKLQLLQLDGNHLGSGKSGDLDFFASLTNCSNLQQLGINGNQFGGTLPVSIGNFSVNFTTLYVNDNQLFGQIPTEIENLKSLITLDMGSNFFNGSIPFGIGNLQKLQALNLYANQLSGKIPSSLRNMSRLFLLNLSNNTLEGSIGLSLGNPILQTLDLSYNNFTGGIPKQELGLSLSLINLTLAHNSLNGSIPSEVGDLKNLAYLDVSENKITSEIPPTLGACSSLLYLSLRGNFFHGDIPSSLSSLKSLEEFDLSHNNISGEIPKQLEELNYLIRLNLSFNNIDGEVPIEGIFRNASLFSILGNRQTCGGIPTLGLPKCRIQKSKKQGSRLALKVMLGVLIPSFVVTLFIVILIYLRKRPKAKQTSEQFLGDLRKVSYHDLYKATDGFNSANLIGMGSYGSVYEGILQQVEGKGLIAVKVLNLTEHGASKSFIAECEALREIRHRNLLKILTVCSSTDFNGNDFKALVFEYMPNGSLEGWLHLSSNEEHLSRSLNLSERLNIAIDIASALDYLHNHCERRIVHCDMKSSNVLLGVDMTAHVGDFGLAKFISKTNTTSESSMNVTNSIGVRGTIGYIPPEYGMGAEVSTQGDVYSYGILLLEMFTGKRPTDPMFKDGVNLHNFSKMILSQPEMDIVDMHLKSEVTREFANSINRMKVVLSSIMRIGGACSVEPMVERMEIGTVLKELQSIKEDFLLTE